MAMRDIQALPPHLVALLVEVGPSTLVLVEGDDDKYALNEWYPEGVHNVFYSVAPGGNPGVVRRLDEVLTQTSLRKAFGIIDRDFRSPQEVQQHLEDLDEHLLIWPRYELENYLLQSNTIRKVLRSYYGNRVPLPTDTEIEAELFTLCQELCPLMAANWVCLNEKVEHLPEGFPTDRAAIIRKMASKLGCSEATAEEKIAKKRSCFTAGDSVFGRCTRCHQRKTPSASSLRAICNRCGPKRPTVERVFQATAYSRSKRNWPARRHQNHYRAAGLGLTNCRGPAILRSIRTRYTLSFRPSL